MSFTSQSTGKQPADILLLGPCNSLAVKCFRTLNTDDYTEYINYI